VASEVTTAAYELKVVAPTLSPGTNSYASAQSVTISTTTPGANITYTTDGTEPTSSSTAYSSAITVSDTRTIKARAFKTGWTDSNATPASYWISSGTVATPTISPAGGTFDHMLLVTLACTTTGATVRYTVDGTTPTIASPLYVYPFLVSQTTTVKAKAFKAGATESAVASSAYSLDVAGQTGIPTIAPAGGRFAAATTVTITGPAGATLRYTTNGVDPTDTDTQVPGSGQVTVDRAQILKVRAWLSGSTPSAVQRADFLVTGMVVAGRDHSLGLDSSGAVWAWGLANFGQIGDGTLVNKTAPVSVLTGVVSIAAGWFHSMALKADGTVWMWGRNESGQIGDGTGQQRSSPVQLSLTNVVAVAAGATHSLALKSDGTVWAWGANTDGQLGTGNFTQSFTPVQVSGLTGASSIAAGENFSLALQPNGASGGFVWTWGKNTSGQLGDASTVTRNQPVQVTGVTTAAAIAAGQAFAIARLANGTVIGWGANNSAQLGTLTGTASNVPVAVPVLVDIASIAAGHFHAFAIDRDGRAWGWGQEDSGQLGTSGESTSVGLPPSVLRFAPASFSVAGGYIHSVVLDVDGFAWGSGNGQATGLGTATYFQFAQIPSFSLAPNNSMLATDADGDGLFAWEEFLAGTDPLAFDTNGNGLSDLVDVRRRSQAVNPDDDGDGVPNAIEVAQGTDPFNADTDGDSVSDLLDDYPLDPTRTTKPSPNPSDTTAPTITLIRPTNATLLSPSGLMHIPAPAGLPPMRNF
jgi:alpha-tubulin suppressor-like RCC1 family protein